jgi:multimeric flavodoxin WrbA
MKVLAISCSPRRQGNTEALLNEALAGARGEGAETELYAVAGKDFRPCTGCRSCDKTGVCAIEDDVPELLDKMLEADGIIFGSPIYSYSVTPWLHMIFDRTLSIKPPRSLKNKVAGVVVTAASLGVLDGLKDIYFWIATRQMLPANFVGAYGLNKGDVDKFKACMEAAKTMGKQIALLAAMGFRYPEGIESARFGYGTWLK